MLTRRSPFSKLLSSRTAHAVFRGGLPKLASLSRRHKSSTNQSQDVPTKETSNQHFSHHKYVDFYRDESMSVGIVTFRNSINGKKNIFGDFLEELKNVIEHITNVISNEETNAFYIKEFPRRESYLVKNLRNRIPYLDNRLKVLIFSWGSGQSEGGAAAISASTTAGTTSSTTAGITSSTTANPTAAPPASTPDYNSFLKNDEQLNVQLANSFRYLCNTIQHLPLITISSINGQCYNSAMDLMISTDFKLSCEGSTFGFNKAHLGLFPYGGSTQKLFRAIPMSYAKYLLLTGDMISAKDALRINLIDICMNKNEDFFIDNCCVHFDTSLTKKQKSIKMSIMEGMSLAEPNLYLDHDRAVFERNMNAPQRGEILAYLKRRASGAPAVPT
ncbi:enoyl-CoA hydratase/isomerase family protein [Plasmodium cynomolgi strain B]|uniref:Enoyl-CoA hydratase/isomerase family protein n=1 Tax=Plasmodium cynomolgi (strain B) TaxID=1120755 RepID=K6UMB4_PLACD|nr:enoyl-CoA hydratase/isomerase family protein [Plasmodium cynomolgi strain B]GAB68458.1 enoyl-CoA hydratase/isomerase family protein [Plasmodium cynomolgi strain B]